MKRFTLFFFLFSTLALGASGDRYFSNTNSNKDIIVQVNKGGSTTDAIKANGTTGGVSTRGTNTNDDAAAGFAGEYTSVTGTWQPVTANNVSTTALSLTAGDWDVELITISEGNVAAGTTGFIFGISTDATGTTFTDTATTGAGYNTSFAPANTTRLGGSLTIRKSLSATTNVYGKAQATGANATGANPYFMRARRAR